MYTQSEYAAALVGMSSITFWVLAQLPQLIVNFQLRKVESLSWMFIAVWLTGDITNLVGCVLTKQLPFQTYLAAYFVVMDGSLMMQWIYYTHFYKRNDVFGPILSGDADEEASLYEDVGGSYSQGGSQERTRFFRSPSRTGGYGTIGSSRSILLIGVLCLISCVSPLPSESFRVLSEDSPPTDAYIVGQIFAWTSLACYLFSRIPQAYKNYKRASVAGLSIWLFIFAVLGNATYTASIFLKSTDQKFLMKSLPYILGSSGTLLFDLTIFGQYLYFQAPIQLSPVLYDDITRPLLFPPKLELNKR